MLPRALPCRVVALSVAACGATLAANAFCHFAVGIAASASSGPIIGTISVSETDTPTVSGVVSANVAP